MEISAIIPTYNGAELLKNNLPRVIESLSSYISEIIVVDNGSTDNTEEFINQYPVRYIKLNQNYGFSKAVNIAAKQAKGDYLLLLNNDVKPEKNFVKTLLKNFQTDIFSVTSLQYLKNNKEGGASYGFFKNGLLRHDDIFKINPLQEIFYPNGGAAMVDRAKYNQLNGFLEIYSPFYWEDADLGLRAWRRGWKSILVKESVVFHHHEATASKLNRSYVKLIGNRNWLIFNLIHLDFKRLLLMILFLPANIINQSLKGNWTFIFSFLYSIIFIKKIIFIRKSIRKTQKFDLNKILAKWE